MGGVLSWSSFRQLTDNEKAAVESALWSRHKKLGEDLAICEGYASTNNVKTKMRHHKAAMKKLGLLKYE